MCSTARATGQPAKLKVRASFFWLTISCFSPRDNKKHGKGKYEDLTVKGVYDGEWENGTQNGYGVHNHVNGERYEGQWIEGKPHGNGKTYLADGSLDETRCGTFIEGVLEVDDAVAMQSDDQGSRTRKESSTMTTLLLAAGVMAVIGWSATRAQPR